MYFVFIHCPFQIIVSSLAFCCRSSFFPPSPQKCLDCRPIGVRLLIRRHLRRHRRHLRRHPRPPYSFTLRLNTYLPPFNGPLIDHSSSSFSASVPTFLRRFFFLLFHVSLFFLFVSPRVPIAFLQYNDDIDNDDDEE